MTKYLFALLLLVAPSAWAQGTFTANTCSQADVKAVITGPQHVAVNGDTIVIPAGTCTWGNNVQGDVGLSIPVVINLQGAGQGVTILNDNEWKSNAAANCQGAQSIMSMTGTANIAFRWHDFTVNGVALDPDICNPGHVTIQGNSQSMRVDHITWTNQTTSGISTFGNLAGVVDHCTFNASGGTSTGHHFAMRVQQPTWGGVGGFGDNSWAQPDNLGSQAGVIYMEDNTYNDPKAEGAGCFDNEDGTRLVFRKNHNCSFVATHGNDSGGRIRSGRQLEVYDNAFVATTALPSGQSTALFLRGGSGVIFNNTFSDTPSTGYLGSKIQVINYRDSSNYCPWGPAGASCPGQAGYGRGACDGTGPFDHNDGVTYASGTVTTGGTNTFTDNTKAWTVNQWVGYSVHNFTGEWGSLIISNTANSLVTEVDVQTTTAHTFNNGDSYQILHAYPCMDQVGSGQGALIANTNPTPIGPVNNALDPIYQWLNLYTTNNQYVPILNRSAVINNLAHIAINRDYYDYVNAGSTTTSPGNGTVGVGSGTLAQRPATCTTGVGYWVTNQGSWDTTLPANTSGLFYKCTATNTWTLAYTPLVYPHPLVSGSLPFAVAPTCTPTAGNYQVWTLVACSTTSSPSVMCYTVDGSTPQTNGTTGCAHGTQYATTPIGAPSPITVSVSGTLQIVAGGTGFSDSSVTSNTYTITGDKYGGRLDIPCTNATGVFTVVQIGSRWFFCTPQGHVFRMESITMGTNSVLNDCNGVNQGLPNYIAKYGAAGSSFNQNNWAAATTARVSHWGFNTAGEASVATTYGSATCSSCSWPGHIQPFPLAYVIENKPAENAAQNLNNLASGPIKDAIVGTNSNWKGYRGSASFDAFDPGLAATFAAELASANNAPIRNNDPNILYTLTDDSDFFAGSGGTTDFTPNLNTGSSNNPTPHLGWMYLLTSPVQTVTMCTNVGCKELLYPNPQNYTKTQALNPVTTCSITNPCSLRDYLKQKYGTITALNAAWGSNYTTFDSSATVATNETPPTCTHSCTTDGVTSTFTLKTAHGNIDPFSIQVFVGGVFQMGDCPWTHNGGGTANSAVCFVTNTPNIGTLASPVVVAEPLENHSVPAASPFTVTVNKGPDFVSNTSVKYHATGVALASVTPATFPMLGAGQYYPGSNANNGLYTFSSADAGQSLDFQYNTAYIDQPTSTIDYTGGNIVINFVNPAASPAPGLPITISYQANGWMQGGTGLMDEDGTHTAWVGTNSWCLHGANAQFPTYFSCVGPSNSGGVSTPDANATFGADITAWIPEFAAQYFKSMHTTLQNAGSKLLYFGSDAAGELGLPPPAEFMAGEAPYVDGVFHATLNPLLSSSNAEWLSRIQYLTTYLGNKPFTTFNVQNAKQDSAYSCNTFIPLINYASQPARGQAWFSYLQSLLNTTGANGTIQSVGDEWWVNQDFQNANLGLTSLRDNAYDGVESVVGNVSCDNYYTVQGPNLCGGELATANAPYGDAITQVTQGNRLWLGTLTGSVAISPPTENFGTINIGSSGTPQVATVSNFTTSPTSIVSTTVTPIVGTPAGDFSVTANTCTNGLVLAANGGSCQVTTNYVPTAVGAPKGATLTVTITGGTQLNVTMSGAGGSSGAPNVTFSPTSGIFIPTGIGLANAVPVTLQNTGTAPLLITSIITGGTNGPDFQQANNCPISPASLPVGQTCIITVRFIPQGPIGTRNGSLIVFDNAAGNPQSIPLTGSAVPAPAPNPPFLSRNTGAKNGH